MTDETDDLELAARAAGGDADAFRRLYDRYRIMVYTLALRLTRHDADAEDVLQQTFVRVHRALPSFRGEAKLSTWIYQVALSVGLTERKRARRRPASLEGLDEDAPQAPSGVPSPPANAERADTSAWLQRHLAALPARDCAVLHMRFTEERPMEEIAQILGVPVGTAKSLVFRAKAELRRNIERERGPDAV